jgi:3'(2'), 5'-bisphosphate nucleotidase
MAKEHLPPPAELATELITLAERAGAAIMKVYERADFGTTTKADSSPLTQADLASHRVIAEGLEALSPGVPVLSEESKTEPFETRRGWPRFWLVDPLDGTKEFIKRNGEFTVNIALIEGDAPVLGVVHAPATALTYWAAAGVGAFKGPGQTTPLTAASFQGGTLNLVASRSHAGAETETLVAALRQDLEVELVSIGSSLKLCLVADGQAHLYPRFGPTMEWDTAAAQCVVEAAGGFVRDTRGERLRYNKENLLNPHFIASADSALFKRAARVVSPSLAS